MIRFSSRYCNKISYLGSYVNRKIAIFVLRAGWDYGNESKNTQGKAAHVIKGENIVRCTKFQRIRWLGHIERIQDTAIPKTKDVRKAVCKKTKRKTKNEMAG